MLCSKHDYKQKKLSYYFLFQFSPPFELTIWAGTPATATFSSSTFFVTTALAPIATLFAILTPPTTTAPIPTTTPSPNIGES